MSILLHCVIYIPLTMIGGAYVWVKQATVKEVLVGLLSKLKRKSGS
jgi:hypothetical protein